LLLWRWVLLLLLLLLLLLFKLLLAPESRTEAASEPDNTGLEAVAMRQIRLFKWKFGKIESRPDGSAAEHVGQVALLVMDREMQR